MKFRKPINPWNGNKNSNHAKPDASSLEARLEQHVQLGMRQSMAYAAERADQVDAANDKLMQHLPGFLNAAATVPAFSHQLLAYRTQLDSAEQKISQLAAELANVTQRVGELSNSIDTLTESQNASSTRLSKLDSITGMVESLRVVVEGASQQTNSVLDKTDRATAEISNLWKAGELATSEIGKLWQRVEFVRNEMLYELRYSLQDRSAGEHAPDNDKIRFLNEKVISHAKKGSLKVNLGCGHMPMAGYVNVDARELPGVDIVADIGDLPFEAGSLAVIHSSHVLEHFPEQHLRRLLPYWKELLQPGGRFVAVVPDGEAMLTSVNNGEMEFADFRAVLFGSQEYEGDFHLNLFTPDSLSALLQEAGFSKIAIVEKGRRNGNCLEFEIDAVA